MGKREKGEENGGRQKEQLKLMFMDDSCAKWVVGKVCNLFV